MLIAFSTVSIFSSLYSGEEGWRQVGRDIRASPDEYAHAAIPN